jgi:hypothetical protein
MDIELDRMWVEAAVTYMWYFWEYMHGGAEGHHERPQTPGLNLNLGPPEYDVEMLPT